MAIHAIASDDDLVFCGTGAEKWQAELSHVDGDGLHARLNS
ncbi:protein of unknown function [Lactiplantibacillus plantarum]